MSQDRINVAPAGEDTKDGRSIVPLLIGVIAVVLIVVFISVASSMSAERRNDPAKPQAQADSSVTQIMTREQAQAAGMFNASTLGKGTSLEVSRQIWPAVALAVEKAAAGWDASQNKEALKSSTAIIEAGNNLDNSLLDQKHSRDQQPTMVIEASRQQWEDTVAVLRAQQQSASTEDTRVLSQVVESLAGQLLSK